MGHPETKRVLKADTTRSLQYEIAYNFEDLEGRCQQYIEQVRGQARALIVEAQAESDSIRQTAQSEGYDKGYQEGLARAEQEIQKRIDAEVKKQVQAKTQSAIPAIKEIANSIATQRLEWLSEWESKGIHLAIAVAERILRKELAAHPETVIPLIQELLEMVTGESYTSIYLHPDDAAFLEEQQVDLNTLVRSASETNMIIDDSITPGGCFVRTQHGEIDARLETQLSRLAEELLPGHDES